MTTVVGKLPRTLEYNEISKHIQDFITIRDDGLFSLDLKAAGIETRCKFSNCPTLSLTSYCSIHKLDNRAHSKKSYRNRTLNKVANGLCVRINCNNHLYTNIKGRQLTYCLQHTLDNRKRSRGREKTCTQQQQSADHRNFLHK